MSRDDKLHAGSVQLTEFLDDLSTWLGGMAQFIAATKREWQHAPTGYHLAAQRLRKQTLDLQRNSKALAVALGEPGPQSSEPH